MMMLRKISETRAVILPKEIKKNNSKISVLIKIKFIDPHQLIIDYTPLAGGLYEVSKKLQYQNGKWIELK